MKDTKNGGEFQDFRRTPGIDRNIAVCEMLLFPSVRFRSFSFAVCPASGKEVRS